MATFPWQPWLCLITRPHIDSKEPLNTRAWTKWSSSCRRLFKCIFMNSQFLYFAWNLINFIPQGPNDNKSALVRWWLVAEQSASHFLNQWWYCMLTCSLPQCVKLSICSFSLLAETLTRYRLLSVKILHYNDVTMDAIASQITSLMIVYSTVYSDADQRKH